MTGVKGLPAGGRSDAEQTGEAAVVGGAPVLEDDEPSVFATAVVDPIDDGDALWVSVVVDASVGEVVGLDVDAKSPELDPAQPARNMTMPTIITRATYVNFGTLSVVL